MALYYSSLDLYNCPRDRGVGDDNELTFIFRFWHFNHNHPDDPATATVSEVDHGEYQIDMRKLSPLGGRERTDFVLQRMSGVAWCTCSCLVADSDTRNQKRIFKY